MYTLHFSKKFKKDYKKIKRSSNFKKEELVIIFNILKKGETLDIKHQNHKLSGDFLDCYECHVQPNVLLIYKIYKKELKIELIRLGSHAELF